MISVRTKICLLDDHPWRRHAFSDSLSILRTNPVVESTGLTEAAHQFQDDPNCLVIAVLGGQLLSWPQSETLVRSLSARTQKGGLVVVCEAVTSDCIALALRLGLRGILTTRMPMDMLDATLNFLLAGGTYIPHSETLPAGSDVVAGYLPPPEQTQVATPVATPSEDIAETSALDEETLSALTRRQRDVAIALAIGASNKEIARELNLSESTVKTHIRQIMRKFDASNRTQAALKARAITKFSAKQDRLPQVSRFG